MPTLTLFLSLFVLSQSAIFIRFANTHAVAIGFWRMLIALPVLLVFLLWRGKAQELKALSRKQWLAIFFCGFFLFAHFYTWFLSVQKTSLAHSMILFCANPLFTALGAWIFFRERATVRYVLAMAFCFAGIYCLLMDKQGVHSLEGDVLGILCSVLFSAYVLMGKGIRKNVSNLPFAFATYSVCVGFFFVQMLALGLPFFSYTPQAWAAFTALAFGSTLLGHSLFTYCLQFFSVNFLSVATLVEPLFTSLSGYLLFHEPLTRAGMIGFFLVGVGIIILYLPLKKISS